MISSKYHTCRWLILGLLLVAAAGQARRPPAWSWKLPNADFQEMNVFERDQYQRAEQLFEKKQFKLAGTEFDKFSLQFADSPAVSPAVFMKAYCMQNDLKRSAAIKVFQQVIDYWPDDAYFAGAAMYQIGSCYLANGDLRAGLKEMQKMVMHKEYRHHPLAAQALKWLADNARKNDDMSKALGYWRQTYEDFYESNRQQADWSRDESARYYIKTSKFSKIEDLVKLHNWKEPKTTYPYYTWLWDRAYHEVFASWYQANEAEQKKKDAEAFYKYWLKGRLAFLEKDRKWDFLSRSLNFALRYRRAEKKVWEPLAEELVGIATSDARIKDVINILMANAQFDAALPLTAKVKDAKSFHPWFFDRLLYYRRYDHAEHVLPRIVDTSLRAWKSYELSYRREKWKACEEILKEVLANDKDRSRSASYALARIYKDRTRKYDEAIKLYSMINEPPGTAFEIAECYRRKKDYKTAHNTYMEIENFFPKSGAEAAWRRAEMYHHARMKDKAIAEYRRLLKVYKDKGQSSRAHERLENYGIDSGGGVLDK